MKLPRWPQLPHLDELRALVNEGGVLCETRSGPEDPTPVISTLVQVDGDLVTMIDPEHGTDADELVQRHVADIARFFVRTERTLRVACSGTATLLGTTIVLVTGFVAGWWQAAVGLAGGALAGLVSRLLTALGRTSARLRSWAAAVAGMVAVAVAAAFDRPGVLWLVGLGLVLAAMVPLGRFLAGAVIRRRLGR